MALATTFMLYYNAGEAGINALSYAALLFAALSFNSCRARL